MGAVKFEFTSYTNVFKIFKIISEGIKQCPSSFLPKYEAETESNIEVSDISISDEIQVLYLNIQLGRVMDVHLLLSKLR
jgi:hypothetical protein